MAGLRYVDGRRGGPRSLGRIRGWTCENSMEGYYWWETIDPGVPCGR